ncbi:hypothetical protein V9T40_005484 [Parthenolecanium corni]|uniref:C2H2-type domain-containing protein n=1 Tax=Parthenolecanium corni TaxID=536013 RepID=A0AAN9THF6_9HEMI
MYKNHPINMPCRINPRNLGFYISPDITIEYVRSNAECPDIESSDSLPHNEPLNSDDEDSDPYFNPLTFCAIKMDDEDEELQQNERSASMVKLDCVTKVCKKVKLAQTNENSSFVCNGTSISAEVKPKKRHACHLCPKTFGWTTDLKRHLLIHTGERPFKCTMCNATFTRNFLLQKHKTKIHQCLSPSEVSQLNNNVAKNLMEIKKKMRELEDSKIEVKITNEEEPPQEATC